MSTIIILKRNTLETTEKTDSVSAPAGVLMSQMEVNGNGRLHVSQDFLTFVSDRLSIFLEACEFLKPKHGPEQELTRPLLGAVIAETAQLEELLDAYGARNHLDWYTFRERIAGLKAFSVISYKLLHLQHFYEAYHLEASADQFHADTSAVLNYLHQVICGLLDSMIKAAEALDLPVSRSSKYCRDYNEVFPPGMLPDTRPKRRMESAENTVVSLATAFLHLIAECEFVHRVSRKANGNYAPFIPDPINEASLRLLEYKFHNLQSRYDTYVSGTNTEKLDPNLPILRGHITFVFHQAEIGLQIVHFFERHLRKQNAEGVSEEFQVIDPEKMLRTVFAYNLNYAARSLVSARRLCQTMLRTYSVSVRMELPVPKYRGFHVRPSTLLAKIVLHYGCDAHMELLGESYDVSEPLNLFRANEALNAVKRRRIAQQINECPMDDSVESLEHFKRIVRRILLKQAENNRIVFYEYPVDLSCLDHLFAKGAPPASLLVNDAVAHLLALGKIDIETDENAVFVGDKRALEDIRKLADCGYGEDRFGNNIPLPDALSYLNINR